MDNTDAIKHHLVRGFNEPSNLTMPGTRAPLYAQSCIELVTLEKVCLLKSQLKLNGNCIQELYKNVVHNQK